MIRGCAILNGHLCLFYIIDCIMKLKNNLIVKTEQLLINIMAKS